jgi:hypothetical protein
MEIRIVKELICCTCLVHTATVTVLERAMLREILIMKYNPALKYVQTKKTELLVSGKFPDPIICYQGATLSF